MIGYLKGTPIISSNSLLVITQGVGYQIDVASSTLQKISAMESVELYISTQLRQDSLTLYGFLKAQEKELFETVLQVSGVGPRTALAIVGLGVPQVIEAIHQADISVFTAIPRVGKKVAQKLIIELKNKVGATKELDLSDAPENYQVVVSGLQSLGYSEAVSLQLVKNLPPNLSVEAALKQALQQTI